MALISKTLLLSDAQLHQLHNFKARAMELELLHTIKMLNWDFTLRFANFPSPSLDPYNMVLDKHFFLASLQILVSELIHDER